MPSSNYPISQTTLRFIVPTIRSIRSIIPTICFIILTICSVIFAIRSIVLIIRFICSIIFTIFFIIFIICFICKYNCKCNSSFTNTTNTIALLLIQLFYYECYKYKLARLSELQR